ncbi:DUF676-domain-containing protein [Marasmius fiardii PR-910]|nr:DUF676-domain-containing protein [Marasmius fiardii PR-910]
MSQQIHLLVLVHGMWGNPSHLQQLEILASRKPGIHVLLPQTNAEDSTYDGIDWGGERVAQEILETVDKLAQEGKTVTKFSITGYSLGGLVSRYVIGILHQKRFFDNVIPVNFNTIATPHLGLPKYPNFLSYMGNVMGPRLLSRTGEQFYCVDKWSNTGRSLLEAMADPQKVFYQALSKFQEIRIFANAVYDRTVPYVTAAIEVDDPFIDYTTNDVQITFHEDYPRVIKTYSKPSTPSSLKRKSKDKSNDRKPPALLPFPWFRFPVNIAIYASLPLLLPTVATLVVVRFSKASKRSKERIKLLEEGEESLAKVLAKMEKAAGELAGVEESGLPISIKDVDSPSPTAAPVATCKKAEGVLSPLQRKMASQLNLLPIKKELAFLDEVYNSHGSIIMRDLERFEFQKCGEGLVRRWGDLLQT